MSGTGGIYGLPGDSFNSVAHNLNINSSDILDFLKGFGPIALFSQFDDHGAADGSEWPDVSGNDNDIEQETGAKQPTVTAGGVPYVAFDGTDDYMSQAVVVAHDSLTPTDSRC